MDCGSRRRRATCTFPPTATLRSIPDATSRCALTTSTRSGGSSPNLERGSRTRHRSPDGAACTCSIRSATRSSSTKLAAEFRFSPRPNRASEIRWRPWSDSAFAEAKDQSKPVLLAISAVWCHWCHMIDETSYSVPEIIEKINESYIPVRVDNDQRPDVNRRYNMGGWPTTAFLTPDGDIIHGGTYIGPQDMWQTVNTVGAVIRGQYDPQFGGFGREPKFPQVRLLRFLLDEFRRHGYPDVAHMLHKTLGTMATSGMHDDVEGGFFRYATTRQWQIPHYEKMLEDNAELLTVYAEAHRTFPEAGYDRVVRDIVRWMDAVLWREDIAAFSGSQDADEHYYTLDADGRAKAEPPFVDRAMYTSWNALAISGYVAAAQALDDASVRARGLAALRTIATRMWDEEEGLAHFDRGEGPQLRDLLGDLAAVLTAQLDAYESVEHPIGIVGAGSVAARIRDRLEDAEHGGFFDAPERAEPGREEAAVFGVLEAITAASSRPGSARVATRE